MKRYLVTMCVVIVLILLWFYGRNIFSVREEENIPFKQELNQEYEVNFDLNANSERDYLYANSPIFALKKGQNVTILEQSDQFSKVIYPENVELNLEGWIPSFYLSDESKNIHINAPYLALVNKAKMYSLPLEDTKRYADEVFLEEKVVKVYATYGDFSLINFIRYDSPEFDYIWVKTNDLESFNYNLAKEGRVRKNAKVYDDDALSQIDNDFYYEEICKVGNDRTNDVYMLELVGGVTKYVNAKDFIPLSSPNDIYDFAVGE